MGLAVFVGVLADTRPDRPAAAFHRRRFAAVSAALERAGLPPHREPLDVEPRCWQLGGSVGLQCLRRAAAHLSAGRALPEPGGRDAARDPLLLAYQQADERLARQGRGRVGDFDHLIRHPVGHSGAEGVYVPEDFAEVIVPDLAELREAAGERIGSAPRLRDECERLAAALGLPGDLDPAAEELRQAADHQGGGAGWRRYGLESSSCLRLLAAARYSIGTGAAVVIA